MHNKVLFVFLYAIGDTFLLKSYLDAYCRSTGTPPSDVVLLISTNAKKLVRLLFERDGYQCCLFNPETWFAELEAGGTREAAARLSENALVNDLEKLGPYKLVYHFFQGFYGKSDTEVIKILKPISCEHRRAMVLTHGPASGREWVYSSFAALQKEGLIDSFVTIPFVDEETGTVKHFFELCNKELAGICSTPVPLQLQQVYLPDTVLHGLSNYICINIGCSTPSRKAPRQLLGDFAELMLVCGLQVVILGAGAQDEADAQTLADYLQTKGVCTDNIVYMLGPTSCKQRLFEQVQRDYPALSPLEFELMIIHGAIFTITNDTGVAHLSHCLHSRIVVLTLHWHAYTCFPYPDMYNIDTTRVLWHSLCEGCGPSTQYACQYWITQDSAPCIASISVQELVEATKDWLEGAISPEQIEYIRKKAGFEL